MNKWKIAFWICLVLLLLTGGIGFFNVIDQAVTITYMRDGYSDTESDLESLIDIINKTELDKDEIKEILKQHDFYEYMDFSKDSVSLKRSMLFFKGNKLEKVKMDW